MSYGLPSFRSRVDDEPVPPARKPELTRQVARGDEKPAHQSRVGFVQLVDRPDVLPGDEQDVGGRSRMQVPEGENVFVRKDDDRG